MGASGPYPKYVVSVKINLLGLFTGKKNMVGDQSEKYMIFQNLRWRSCRRGHPDYIIRRAYMNMLCWRPVMLVDVVGH